MKHQLHLLLLSLMLGGDGKQGWAPKSKWFFFGVIKEALDKLAHSHVIIANPPRMSSRVRFGTEGI